MTKMHPHIEKPCSENWDKMTPNEQGRHCEKCAMTVIDFTRKSENEIIEIVHARAGERTCGRMRKTEITATLTEVSIYPQVPFFDWNISRSIYTLSIASLLIGGCNFGSVKGEMTTGQIQARQDSSINTSLLLPDSTKSIDSFAPSCAAGQVKPPIDQNKDNSTMRLGKMAIVPDTADPAILKPIKHEEITIRGEMSIVPGMVHITDNMPEFPGGESKLLDYIKAHIIYPESEKSRGISGRVVATFVVDTLGNLQNIQIVKSVPDGPNFDAEVIRLLENMPRWRPAENNGKKTSMKIALPIRFKLENN